MDLIETPPLSLVITPDEGALLIETMVGDDFPLVLVPVMLRLRKASETALDPEHAVALSLFPEELSALYRHLLKAWNGG